MIPKYPGGLVVQEADYESALKELQKGEYYWVRSTLDMESLTRGGAQEHIVLYLCGDGKQLSFSHSMPTDGETRHYIADRVDISGIYDC